MADQAAPQTETVNQTSPEASPPVETPVPPAYSPAGDKKDSGPTMDMLMDVNLQLTVELGSTQMTVRQVLDLQKGAVIELNRIAGDAVDILVNDRLLARGEVVVVDDKFGVRITELVSIAQDLGEA
ncbi:MAG: flagellar motor switch protein FliN [Anaerolineales bacterium]|nr:flagellar motor switch protein FliN [Anaerolineales bacterium]